MRKGGRTFRRNVVVSGALVVLAAVASAQSNPPPREAIIETLATDSILQYHVAIESLDYFDQFTWGDDIFERYLAMFFGLERTAFEIGDGATWQSRAQGVVTRIELALLDDDDATRLWRFAAESAVDENGPPLAMVYVEVLVSPDGIPLEIRYTHPEIGVDFRRIPVAANDGGPPPFLEGVVESDLERISRWRISELRWTGREAIAVLAGSFDTEQFVDTVDGVTLEYSFDFDLPGSLVRMRSVSPDGEELLIVELIDLTAANTTRFDESTLLEDPGAFFVEEDPYDLSYGDESGEPSVSEGTVDEPVAIEVGSYHDGTVAEGATSYYAIFVPKRCDLSVTAYGLAGGAELISYAGDSTYTEWVNSSSGEEPQVEVYHAASGSTLYVAVVDEPDGGVGRNFTLLASPEYVLDPIGVIYRDDFIEQAREIPIGKAISVPLGREALHYFRTPAGEHGFLRIEAEDVPDGAGLQWADASGNWDEVFWSAEDGRQSIVVRGLEQGTIAYYYLVGEPDGRDAETKVTVRVTSVEGGQ